MTIGNTMRSAIDATGAGGGTAAAVGFAMRTTMAITTFSKSYSSLATSVDRILSMSEPSDSGSS